MEFCVISVELGVLPSFIQTTYLVFNSSNALIPRDSNCGLEKMFINLKFFLMNSLKSHLEPTYIILNYYQKIQNFTGFLLYSDIRQAHRPEHRLFLLFQTTINRLIRILRTKTSV